MNGLIEIIKVFANGKWSPAMVMTIVILAFANQWFVAVDQRFDQMDQRLDRMDQRLDRMDQRLDRMDQRFDAMDARLTRIEERFELVIVLEERMKHLHPDLYQGSFWTPAEPTHPYRLGAGPLFGSHEAFGACPNPFHPRAASELLAWRLKFLWRKGGDLG